MAYPSFNVNEIIAIADLYEGSARDTGRPIIVFNGELDRIRSGYYPRLVYRKLAKLADDFIPLFESTLYIHNFKGARSGALFRVYPGPWQVNALHIPCTATHADRGCQKSATCDEVEMAAVRNYVCCFQVMKRSRDGLQTVHTQETMPSLKQVALDILPNA